MEKSQHYEQNPFKLAFNGLNKAFKINQNPSIAILVYGFLAGIGQSISNVVAEIPGPNNSTTSSQIDTGIIIFIVIAVLLASLVGMVIDIIASGFKAVVGARTSADQSISLGDGLKLALSKFFPVIAIQILVFLYSAVWLLPALLIIIPLAIVLGLAKVDSSIIAILVTVLSIILGAGGLFMAVRASLKRQLALYIMFDKGAGIMQSLNESVRLTKGRLIEVMGVAFAAGIIPIINPLLIPVAFGEYYRQILTFRDNKLALPRPNIWSWLPIIVVGGILLLIGLFIGLIALIALAARS